jgi:hypothetical protein
MQRELVEQIVSPAGRRDFIRKAGMAGVAGAALMASNGLAQSAITDVDIVNFALNLEYLEAEFYSVATTGRTIDQFGLATTGSGAAGATNGGGKVTLSDGKPLFVNTVAMQIAADERAHVVLLRNALGSMGIQPIAKPAINLDALGIGFRNEMEFLTLARVFEDLGVTAYAGAAGLIKDKGILGTAARIFGAEAQHAATIRLQVAKLRIMSAAVDPLDVPPPPVGSMYFSLDSNALVQTRTPGQVLFLAYGGKENAVSGGFFPNGVNGTIKAASSQAQPNPCAA